MLKKLAVSAAVLISVVAGAATVLDVEGVNKAVAKILEPFNNDTTTAKLEFTYLDIAEGMTQRFGGVLGITKIGKENELAFNISKLDYQYKGETGVPTVDAAADLKLDLVKLLGQKEINEIAGDAAKMVVEFGQEMTKEYGEAVTTEAAVEVLEKDEAGDVVRLKIRVGATIDLSKLPEGKTVDSVEATGGVGTFDFTRNSATLTLNVKMNPDYKGFKSDQTGMKEYIEMLLAGNKETYDQLGEMMGFLDQIATMLVEEKAKEEQP